MGALHCYLQRAHGVLVADGNYMFTMQTLNSFDIFWFFLRARLSTKQPLLYFFFTNGIRVICIIGRSIQYSFIPSVLPCMNCAVRVFRFHTLRATTQREVFKCEMTWPGKLTMLYL